MNLRFIIKILTEQLSFTHLAPRKNSYYNRGQGCRTIISHAGPLRRLFPASIVKPFSCSKKYFTSQYKMNPVLIWFFKGKRSHGSIFCLPINRGKRMSFRRFCRTLSNPLKKTMTPNTQISTVNTGSSTLRRQSSVSLKVETTQKVSHGLSVTIRTAATNISVLSHVKAGIYAQAVTKKGPCCSRNTSQKTYS